MRIKGMSIGLAACVAPLLLAGCQSDKHAMPPTQAGQVAVCRACYDQITTIRTQSNWRTGGRRNQVIKRHMCEDCKTELSVYTEDGVLMAKCAGCAPDGVACDLCTPKPQTK